MYVYKYVHVHMCFEAVLGQDFDRLVIVAHNLHTGWPRPIGCLKLQVIFRKRATNYEALFQKRLIQGILCVFTTLHVHTYMYVCKHICTYVFICVNVSV